MSVNSKRKGKSGELEVAHILRDFGFTEARRSAQYCGNTGDAADVVGIPGFHLEVKRCETVRIWEWIAQAKRDHKDGEIPIVVFRRSREKWQVCIELDEFLKLLKTEKPTGLSE